MNELINKIKIVALFGKSGAGKDSLQRWILSNIKNVNSIISYTTRPKRDYEFDGKDYYFVSNDFFQKMIENQQMIEYTNFNNWYYGTALSSLYRNKINIGVFNIEGINSLFQFSDALNILPIYINTSSDKKRLFRILDREKEPDCKEICRRFLADEKDFENIPFDYVTYLNDCNNRCDFKDILKNETINHFLLNAKND